MQTMPVGPPLVELLVTAYRADLAVLLAGGHGLGKTTVPRPQRPWPSTTLSWTSPFWNRPI